MRFTLERLEILNGLRSVQPLAEARKTKDLQEELLKTLNQKSAGKD